MARLDMDGPFDLTDKVIDAEVNADLIGNFALGFVNKRGKFVVKVIGRGDENLRNDIKAASKTYSGGLLARLMGRQKVNKFKYSFARTAETAYQVECRLFETFGGTDRLLNDSEPVPPAA